MEGLTVEVLLKLHQAAILMYGGADGVLDAGTLHYLQGGVLLCQNSDKAKMLLQQVSKRRICVC